MRGRRGCRARSELPLSRHRFLPFYSLVLSSPFSLSLLLVASQHSVTLDESVHVPNLIDTRWKVDSDVRDGARAGGCMRFYHLHSAQSFARVQPSTLHQPSRISKRVKGSPRPPTSRKRHLYFRRSRAPAAHRRNNISRNLPRSNET